MTLQNIETKELKKFAFAAIDDGWDVDYTSGILNLLNHSLHPDISVCWKKGNESWSILKEEAREENVVPVGELEYPSSILF